MDVFGVFVPYRIHDRYFAFDHVRYEITLIIATNNNNRNFNHRGVYLRNQPKKHIKKTKKMVVLLFFFQVSILYYIVSKNFTHKSGP